MNDPEHRMRQWITEQPGSQKYVETRLQCLDEVLEAERKEALEDALDLCKKERKARLVERGDELGSISDYEARTAGRLIIAIEVLIEKGRP